MDVGEKIRKYRKRMNLSARYLAEKLRVTPAMVSYYEKGVRQVPLKVLMQISEITRVPIEYYVTDKEYVNYSACRGKGKTTKEQKNEIASFHEVVDNLITVAGLSSFDLSYQGPNDYKGQEISDQEIGNIKAILGLPAIVDYRSLAEALWLKWRVVVFELPFKNRTLSAMSVKRDGVYCIFINKGQSTERNLFSLAHELGHVLMHLDADEFIVSKRGSRDPIEKQANDFASRFTVPLALLKDKLGDNVSADSIRNLSQHFNVSYACIVYTLVKANMLRYEKDSIARIKEPVDEYSDKISIDSFPPMYRLLVYSAWLRGELSISKASKYLLSDLQSVNDEFNKINLLIGNKQV